MKKRLIGIATVAVIIVAIFTLTKILIKKSKKVFSKHDGEPVGI